MKRNVTGNIQQGELSQQYHFSQAKPPAVHHPHADRLSQLLMEHLELGVCLTDDMGYFVKVNEAFCQLYGYTSEELEGHHFTMLIPKTFRPTASKLHDAYIAGSVEEMAREWAALRKDGEVIEVYVKPFRYEADDGKVYKVTIVRDLTEEKLLKRQLTDLMHEAEMI